MSSPKAVTSMYKEPSTARLYVAKADKKKLSGLKDAGLEQEVVLVVKGKVRSLSNDEYQDGVSVTVNVDKCKILTGPMSLDKAIEKAQTKV